MEIYGIFLVFMVKKLKSKENKAFFLNIVSAKLYYVSMNIYYS